MAARRPLPTPPGSPIAARPSQYALSRPDDVYSPHPYYASPYSYPPDHDVYDQPPTTLPGGTLLHKGFYDLLAMIPTPSPSRLLWGTPPSEPVLAGPRYEDLAPAPTRTGGPVSPVVNPAHAKKGRRISKDMVSRPTGFVYVFGA